MTITINPIFDAFYYSYYIEGFQTVFGARRLRYSSAGFPDLGSECLAFEVRSDDGRLLKVAIDAYDGSRIRNSTALEWCDVYAKVNLTSEDAKLNHRPTCVAAGPSFPLRVWDPAAAWWMALRNYRRSVRYNSKSAEVNSTHEHFANYRRQYKYRLPLRSFVPRASRNDYIFYLGSLWADEEAPGTNQLRAAYIDACKSVPGVQFEGGLVPVGTASAETVKQFQPYRSNALVPLTAWLDKIRASAVVFNTPAVWGSHAWKLPEFMALAKAIVTTPPVRELPQPLVHGQHAHIVDGSAESLREAVHRLVSDREYRLHLERGARAYYDEVISPTRTIERLLAAARNRP